jgi:hypothetical protein
MITVVKDLQRLIGIYQHQLTLLLKKNKDTTPRLLNFLFLHPDKIARSMLLSTRHQIQTTAQLIGSNLC